MSNSIHNTMRPGLWILGPKRDLLFFILTPLLIIPFVSALITKVPLDALAIYVLGLGGFGHHLPSFLRAYSDQDLFHRYKLRFTLVPALLIVICGLYSFFNLNAMICATVAWGTWHGAMQINGFMRIYDAKVKSFHPWTSRLDWYMCMAWFGLAILNSPAKQFSLTSLFYSSGGPLIPPFAFEALRMVWGFSSIVITILFVLNALRRWKTGFPPSPVKLLTMVACFGFWWYCMVTLNNLILGIVLWEIFHDVQYNVLVWLFQRRRVDANAHVSKAEWALFRPGVGRIALYAALILAYGYIGVYTSYVDINSPDKLAMQGGFSRLLLRITMVSALLHFYFDGFIWQVRDKSIRRGLGVQDGETASPVKAPSPPRQGIVHAWLWVPFLAAVVYMGASQFSGSQADMPAQMENLSAGIPESWTANFFSGSYAMEAGRWDDAEKHYLKAVQYKPDFAIGHFFLGNLYYRKGDYSRAAEHYRRSVELDSNDLEARTNLGLLYLKIGQPTLAEKHIRAALTMDPENPRLTFGMATSLIYQNRLAEAEPYAESTLRLSPHHSGASNYLGMIRDLSGDLPRAVAYYRQALAEDSANASAKENLAAALAKLGPAAQAEGFRK